MKLTAVSIGAAQPTPGRTSSKTGIFKFPVDHPVMVGREGLAGDRIVNRKLHGGPDQALYMECQADLDWWARQLDRPVPPGLFGENLTVEGLASADIAIGDRFEIDDVLLEVTSARTPCATFAARLGDPTIVRRYTVAARPGAYLRVLSEGMIRAGDAVRHVPYRGDRISMAEFIRDSGLHHRGVDRDRYLAAPISQRLRTALEQP